MGLKAVSTSGGGGGGGVTTLDGISGAVTLVQGSGITITDNSPVAGSITIAATVAAPAFNAITSGTNTTAAMVVGSGGTLAASGSGTITATAAPAAGLTGTTLASGVVTSSLTAVGTIGTGTWQGTKVGLAYGGTNADLSATGGTSQVLKQISPGGAVTVAQLAASDLSNGTTGSGGGVVLATGPTISNPVVGTQATTDNSTKAASTAYVTTAIANAIAGVNPAIAVQAATTAAGDTSALTYNNGVSGIGATLTGANNTALTVDGYTFTALGQRLLVKNDTQSPSGAFNGIYYVTQVQASVLPLILTRALDYDAPSDINNTGAIPVVNGTANGTTSWLLTSSVTTVGTDPLTYVKFSSNPTSVLSTTLTSAHLFVGNGSNVATDTALTGDISITNAGVSSVAKINGTTVSGTTGSGNVVFSTSPTLVTPALGTPASGVITNCTGSPTLMTVTSTLSVETNNAVTVTSNAGTCPATTSLDTFTNSSAATMAITITTSGAVDGQKKIVRIYDFSGATQTIGWTNTENSTVTAPTTSNGSTTLPLTVGFMYNSATSKWRCVASA